MKKILTAVTLFVVAFTFTAASFAAEKEYGANDYTGETSAIQSPEEITYQLGDENDNSAEFAKCFFFRRYATYYTPVVYYQPVVYVPVYYYTVTYRYYYSPVVYYAAACYKSAATRGIRINQNPPANSPLATQKIVKGDVITQVDGAPIRSASQIDKITAQSKLTVMKNQK